MKIIEALDALLIYGKKIRRKTWKEEDCFLQINFPENTVEFHRGSGNNCLPTTFGILDGEDLTADDWEYKED